MFSRLLVLLMRFYESYGQPDRSIVAVYQALFQLPVLRKPQ